MNAPRIEGQPPVPRLDRLDPMGHADGALDAQIAADFARRWRDGGMRGAAKIIHRHKAQMTGDLPPEAAEQVRRLLERADRDGERAVRYDAIRDDHVRAISESTERVYGPHSPHSHLLDVARSAVPGINGHKEALDRLDRYSNELRWEARAETPEGRRALRVAETRGREGNAGRVFEEQRAMTSASASGGAFVTPQYVVDRYALYRNYPPAFYDQTVKIEDAGYGTTFHIPAFTSAATVDEQSGENQGIDDSSPTSEYLTAELVTFAGEIDVSLQLFERAGPVQFDQIAYAALTDSLNQQIDQYVITKALTTAGTVAGSSSFTANGLFGDIAKAKSQMVTTAGTKLLATHLWLQPGFGEWMLAQADPDGRPLLLPHPSTTVSPLVPGPDGSPPLGFTGNRLLSTAVMEDGSIPSTGTKTRIVLANMGEVFTLCSEPTVRAIPDTLASDLTVVVQLYCLLGVIVRYAPAVQVITGSAYKAAPTFA